MTVDAGDGIDGDIDKKSSFQRMRGKELFSPTNSGSKNTSEQSRLKTAIECYGERKREWEYVLSHLTDFTGTAELYYTSSILLVRKPPGT